MEINLKTLGLEQGTYQISLVATGKNIVNSDFITVEYTVKAAEMYAPTVSEREYDKLIINDHPSNAGRTRLYKIYKIIGTDTYEYVCSVAYKSPTQEVYNLTTEKYYVVTAVDEAGTESPYSNQSYVASCFVEGTPVLMADGSYKEIQHIVEGDLVQSYNIDEAVYCDGIVSEVAIGYTDRIAMILTDNGSYIAMAEPHPLYTIDGFHSITNKDGYPTLVVGDVLVSAFGKTTITEISVVDTPPTKVFSLGVIPLYGGGSVSLLRQSSSNSNSQRGIGALTDYTTQDMDLQEQNLIMVDQTINQVNSLYFAGYGLVGATHSGGSN